MIKCFCSNLVNTSIQPTVVIVMKYTYEISVACIWLTLVLSKIKKISKQKSGLFFND